MCAAARRTPGNKHTRNDGGNSVGGGARETLPDADTSLQQRPQIRMERSNAHDHRDLRDKGSEAVSVWRPGWGVRQPDAVLQHLQVPRHVRQLPQLQRGLDVPLRVLRQVVHVRRHGGGSRSSRDFRWVVGHIEPDQIQKGWRKR